MRAVFELIHARSAALDHLAQGITGIPQCDMVNYTDIAPIIQISAVEIMR